MHCPLEYICLGLLMFALIRMVQTSPSKQTDGQEVTDRNAKESSKNYEVGSFEESTKKTLMGGRIHERSMDPEKSPEESNWTGYAAWAYLGYMALGMVVFGIFFVLDRAGFRFGGRRENANEDGDGESSS